MDLQELHSHFSFGWRYIILNAVVQIQLSSVMEVYVWVLVVGKLSDATIT